jgi:hypothetical protein
MNVSEFNTLSVTNNISSSSGWKLSGLTWVCGRGSLTNGMALFRGYYTLNNLTSAVPLNFWTPVQCPLNYLSNGTRVVGVLSNVTSYAFPPKSDNASYSAYYRPLNCSSECAFVGSSAFGEFPQEQMSTQLTVYATNSTTSSESSLLSTAPSVYTFVAGDEWGALVLLHFSVTSG